ncbi:MAG: hydroxyisourate hydrolase, partial [Acidobacteria bacterium]|nr:hydroxyisourate hydrolase [Acidobacteriota bacterium]
MSRITTHVLDTSRGRPAAGIAVRLEREFGDGWEA